MIYNLWGNLSLSKIIGGWGGGHPAPPHPFIVQNCVSCDKTFQSYECETGCPKNRNSRKSPSIGE